jgi:hypothetical protein
MLRKPGTSTDETSLFLEGLQHILAHHNVFEESDIRKAYDDAGLVQFEFQPSVCSGNVHGRTIDFFLAKGTKAK